MRRIIFAVLVMMSAIIALPQQEARAESSCVFRQDDMPLPKSIPADYTHYWTRGNYVYGLASIPPMHDREKQEEKAEERARKVLSSQHGKKFTEKDVEVWRKFRRPDNENFLIVLRKKIKDPTKK